MTINQYINKIKSLCRADLEPSSKTSKARMRRIIIYGLTPEYRSFLAIVQGWPT